MSLEINWSEPAFLSLAEFLEYTIIEHGERQALKLRKQVMGAVRRLSVTPFIAAVEPYSERVGVELRGYLVISRIKIIYSIDGTHINIEYIKNTYLSDETMLDRMGYIL